MFLDTHCHLQFKGYDTDREAVIKRIVEKGVVLNIVGTQKDTSKLAVQLAEKYDNFFASIGTHPVHLFPTHINEEESTFLSREEDFDEEYYSELVKSPKVIGVGETGLDLFHLPKDKSKEEVLKKQKEVFLAHVNFAYKHNLPLVIHCRDSEKSPDGSLAASAHKEMIEILQSLNRQIRGTVHCFTGNWEQAQKYLALGLYLGFTGVVTFPPKKTDPKPQNDLTEVLEKCPLDRIVVETDSPYLAPQVCRGQRCEPWMVEEVVKKLAEIKGIEYKEAQENVFQNALNLFTGIKLKLD